MRNLILSGFGSGYLKPASGTWGSLAALPLAWVLHIIGGPLALSAAIVLAFVGGTRLLQGQSGEDSDPSWVVLDEFVGQWIALLPVSIGAAHVGAEVLQLWPGIVSAFLLFRLFDIWKPWPIRLADQRKDAIGIMLDDVLAGILAAAFVVALAGAAHL